MRKHDEMFTESHSDQQARRGAETASKARQYNPDGEVESYRGQYYNCVLGGRI